MLSENNTIAITGATGFLGSHLMAALLDKGHRLIILGRPAGKETLRERLAKLLRWFDVENRMNQLETVEIDFSKPRFGLTLERYAGLCAVTDRIIHCASDTSFSERSRSRVFETNVNGLKTILEFASDSKTSFFHYISTAYSAGVNGGICREELPRADKFTNVYEESKAFAEKIIAEYCVKNSVPLNIIRPSIVYGDSVTGRSLKFDALYFPIKSLLHIRNIYLNDIKIHGGIKSRESGIFLEDDSSLHLPIAIYLRKPGGVNLIPVDYFVNAVLRVMGGGSTGGIYHITSNSPSKAETIVAYSEQFLKIKGVEVIYGKPSGNFARNPAEELFDRFIEPYRPYLADNRIFERKNTDAVTGNISPPECSYEIFKRCMEFAVNVNWGENIFDNSAVLPV